ncbi:MAG: type II secretion system protein [Methylophilaceae bacterium]
MKKNLRMLPVGFTLIELVITVAILALLSSAAFPMAEVAVQRSKEQDLRTALREIREAIDAYKLASDEGHILKKVDESGYPPSLEVLVEGVSDAMSLLERKIYFLRRLPRDPFATDPALSAAQTWGKRSYASSPDEPQEGNDVYDVYTLSHGVGLNRIAYREW